ncbi:TetR/AcrR family transcriptional regulator [Skermania sp. ID1734]|uniref:TetR family transcriptional regulator n=1 Tax=Skermania sp. ID1734 TaxID=2597516 RepID=UPI001180F2DB|nr:TetR family transcriptional regulator [Skermania sp. ID1734]TSD97347.1 TetR/AcrR family transcriptional regulator [Skermania sp. ID1734]
MNSSHEPPHARVPYQTAARGLLRDSVLDALRELLMQRDWSKVTLADVARSAGLSRQTLYNEFGSRTGLAQAYAVRLADELVSHVDRALWANVGDARAAMRQGLETFFLDSASDPLIQSLLTGEVKPDLLRLITIDGLPLVEHATERLAAAFRGSWVRATTEQATALASVFVRLALSYIGIPANSVLTVPEELAEVLAPYVEAIIAAQQLQPAPGAVD